MLGDRFCRRPNTKAPRAELDVYRTDRGRFRRTFRTASANPRFVCRSCRRRRVARVSEGIIRTQRQQAERMKRKTFAVRERERERESLPDRRETFPARER